MSYPQPNADQYSKNGYGFFRLNTLLSSDGDMYLSPQGTKGLAIGPDSDISKVNVAYFDEQVDGFMNQVAISPDRPFPGEIFARNESKYSPSGRAGKFLIWPDDFFNIDYRPSGFDPALNRVDFIVPNLDVVEYFSPVGQIAGRNDKEYHFQQVNFGNDGAIWYLVIPYYGRRYMHVAFANDSGIGMNISVDGITYRQSASSGIEKEVIAATAVATGANMSDQITASQHGMFDALQFRFSGGTNIVTNLAIRIRVSDKE